MPDRDQVETMKITEIRQLFPEYRTDADVLRLLTDVSGDLVSSSPAPVDRTAELASLGRLCREAGPVGDQETSGFESFARAYARQHHDTVVAAFTQSALTRTRSGDLANGFLGWLAGRAHQASLRTLVAVLDQLQIGGHLPATSPAERLRVFGWAAAQPAFRTCVLRVFPELDRQLRVLTDNALQHLRDMLAATSGATAGPAGPLSGRPTELSDITYGLGDTHAGGRAVSLLTFADGRRLVYKPRQMEIERAFNRFVTRINSATGLDLPVLRVWCAPGCGWQEHADGSAPGEPDHYYRACGHLLAVLHLLRASDMHFENVLNHCGGPVVVDAESLFSVNRRVGGDGDAGVWALAGTAFSVGMLPTRLTDPADEDRSMDIGFLGYEPGQEAVTAAPVVTAGDGERLRIEYLTGDMAAPAVRPDSADRTAELAAVCAGFTQVYEWALTHRGQLETWIRADFTGVAVRSVLDATRNYTRLLQTGSHPIFQQSTALKKVLYHRVGVGRIAHVTPAVVRAEIDDLLLGDVPYFSLRTDTTAVYHWDGTALGDVLDRAPLDSVLTGIRELSPTLLRNNLRVIRAAYVDKVAADHDVPRYRPAGARSRPSTVAAATRRIVAGIAGELRESATITDGQPVTWVGATIRNTTLRHPWRVEPLGDDLYAGVPGIALFLAAAGTYLGETGTTRLGLRALSARVEALLTEPTRRAQRATGGMAGGYPGLAYAAIEAGRLSGDHALLDAGAQLWAHLTDDMALLGTGYDFLLGPAGVLAAAHDVAAVLRTHGRSDAPARAVADAAYQRVAAAPTSGGALFSGFAHGTSGTAAAVARHLVVTGQGGDTLAHVLDVHRGLYDESAGQWPISDHAGDRSGRGWCHGTPGILLGACELADAGLPLDGFAGVAELTGEVATAGLGLNPTLCHGDLGNLEILRRAAAYDDSGATARYVTERHGQLCRDLIPDLLAARCSRTVLNNSLYVGLAGIGYGLIALSGEAVASPLSFSRPVEGR
ncbi:type 2 lanthipeptide synthetase LanM [Micromonospora sp. DT228]|uniref:type 2 lanthipeptide synthetase LanM n=1 Tax=Micromonospora sp. DT228 TaxID=3393443 RepID=UPI003CFA99FB